ncbi:MAG TPA: twin-arginine translocase TatA/TatE family subunit [Anaeromyxobacteraceae bacterium]|nr:twin-arginine translocase TatA/TatE family subunit [Anaeromyxobacteraceae bacterium]
MFGLGMGEILIILALALILLGPQKLPDAAKHIGKGLREFRKATEDLRSQFETELYASDTPKPTLVEPPPQSRAPVSPGALASAVPAASVDNVPGLEAALAETEAPQMSEPKAP